MISLGVTLFKDVVPVPILISSILLAIITLDTLESL